MFYLSHAIRGKTGMGTSRSEQRVNCERAADLGNKLRQVFPKTAFYVPGENETFVSMAFQTKHLSIMAILDIDCHIIDSCEGVIIYVPEGDELQGGRKIEYDHAIATNKPVIVFENLNQVTAWLTHQIIG